MSWLAFLVYNGFAEDRLDVAIESLWLERVLAVLFLIGFVGLVVLSDRWFKRVISVKLAVFVSKEVLILVQHFGLLAVLLELQLFESIITDVWFHIRLPIVHLGARPLDVHWIHLCRCDDL